MSMLKALISILIKEVCLMPSVTRKGDKSTGHDSCGGTSLISGSPNVFVNGKPCGRKSDTYSSHGCIVHSSHSDVISGGSSTVKVNGLPIARVGDAVSIGGSVATGSSNVKAG